MYKKIYNINRKSEKAIILEWRPAMYFKMFKQTRCGKHGMSRNAEEHNWDRYGIDEYRFNCDASIVHATVADGVSGTPYGGNAAQEGVLSCHNSLHNRLLRRYVEMEHIGYSVNIDVSFMEDALKKSILDANSHILKNNNENGEIGATTLSSIVITDTYTVAAGIGDSPIYYYRHSDDSFRMVNILHTEADERVMNSEIELYSSEYYNYNHRLTHALGVIDRLNPIHVMTYILMPIEVGDLFLLGTDGAFGCLRDDEVHSIVKRCREDNDRHIIDHLFEAADSEDDQTAILISVEGL